jgi:epsilon-lactone hydrolase
MAPPDRLNETEGESAVAGGHLHGGWFNWDSAAAYRNLVGLIARSANANAFVPEYRLAPEHPFPAALEDAQGCLPALVQRPVRAVAVTGDSAGGNLALSLVSFASRSPLAAAPLVGAAVLSPVTDLAMTGSSWHSRTDTDPYFLREQSETLIKAYLNGHAADDPVASPGKRARRAPYKRDLQFLNASKCRFRET